MSNHQHAEQSLETCRRLLVLAEAQTYALAAQDIEGFARVTRERDALPPVVDGWVDPALALRLRETLERVAAMDQTNLARARELLRATERDLREVHRGQAALRGYSRPGAHLAAKSDFLDQLG